GVEKNSIPYSSGIHSNDADVYIGYYVTGWSSSAYFNGIIDEVAIYDYAKYPSLGDDLHLGQGALNLKSQGKWITAYIEFPEGYDVNEINISSLRLNNVPAESKPIEVGDNDANGIPDLMVKFNREGVQATLSPGDEVEVTLTGVLKDGTVFTGSDTLKVK
ncbi:MAG: hypothetical protein ACE5NL_02125, partial [Candidatus Hydrothermarchaeaceae archaeon]